MELHGGTITAASAGAGAGTTMTVRLPATPRVVAAQPDPSHAAREREAPLRLDEVRVLVVDDDLDAVAVLRELLEQAGADVRTAHSAADGLDTLVRWPPHVLVSDIGMPDMDGLELMACVRALHGIAGQVPAAALTAFTQPEDRQRAIAAGYQVHLTKPIEPQELLSAVSRLSSIASRA
jgi:CheY-like chemotaxis protein